MSGVLVGLSERNPSSASSRSGSTGLEYGGLGTCVSSRRARLLRSVVDVLTHAPHFLQMGFKI